MFSTAVRKQLKILRHIITSNSGASLFRHLGLDGLTRYKDDDLLYQAFTRTNPVRTYNSWQQVIRSMGTTTAAPMPELLQRPKLLSTHKVMGLTGQPPQIWPVGSNTIKNYHLMLQSLEKTILDQGGHRGWMYHVFDAAFGTNTEMQSQPMAYTALQTQSPGSFISKLLKQEAPSPLPQLAKSRYQIMLDMYKQLKNHGPEITTILSTPMLLSQFGMFIAQQQGKFTPLKELCPNLCAYVAIGPTLAPYRTELSYLFAGCQNLIWQRMLQHPSGIIAMQSDPNIPQRFAPVTDDVFYEFIPVEDIHPNGELYRDFRRFHLGQIKVNDVYMLLVSTPMGVLSMRSDWLVRVINTDPLEFMWVRSLNMLSAFSEFLPEELINRQIDEINAAIAGHGLFIRDYHVVADLESNGHHWIMELSRPVQDVPEEILQSIVKRLHTELELQHKPYRESYRQQRFHAPSVTFVPVGTFATLPDSLMFQHLDTQGHRSISNALLRQAGQNQHTISAAMLLH